MVIRTNTPPAISVTGLRKSYGNREVVRGVSFDVAAGECFGLLGHNGAGKTTTISILTGEQLHPARDARDDESKCL